VLTGEAIDQPELLLRSVVDACTDCDCCRYIMDTSCLFFPRVYQLWDRERETGEAITPGELRRLADLCNYCALCPCPNIREDIITAKTLFIDRDGLAPYIRTLEDVERVGKLCGALPRLSNLLLSHKRSGRLIKQLAGIHPKRKLPRFPEESFPAWARRRALHKPSVSKTRHKVAYFAGCTARYLFPSVARAVVAVLRENHIPVFYPEQNCCGMPSMLEGDRKVTLQFARRTVSRLAATVADGYDIVCSCPTCGYMLKIALREKAYYSREYQDLVGDDEKFLKIPEWFAADGRNRAGTATPEIFKATFGGHHMAREVVEAVAAGDGSLRKLPVRVLSKSIYGRILRDDGYFSGIDPLQRIAVAENTYDLGEYLLVLLRSGELATQLRPITGRHVYYPPCHLREQEIGQPWLELLGLVPCMALESFPSTSFCCGIAGIMGFKRDFHTASIQMGSRLMARIKRMDPDCLVTDCLSCRLQFNQMSKYPVAHPIEILEKAYG